MYNELIKRLRVFCEGCKLWDGCKCCLKGECSEQKSLQAADAIEQLQKDLERSKDFEAFWQHEAEEALKKFQVAISNKPCWIPVTERLPEDFELVLTCDERGNIHIFPHLRYFKYPFGIRPEDPRYFMPKWWMPLPGPPKEE